VGHSTNSSQHRGIPLNMEVTSPLGIRLAAIGDLLLTTRPGEGLAGRGLETLSEEIRQLFESCDIVLANFECTLPGENLVATEPRVFTSVSQTQGLMDAGINVVTLGNNHAFDAGDEGLKDLTALLNNLNISWLGAGLTSAEASRPLILTVKGLRIAIIAVVDASSGMYRFAGPASSGVAPFDEQFLCQQIEELRRQVDHIIISPHWGDERFRFPSPKQIEEAHTLIDAGASMILGHHPHVVQGMEFYQNSPIVYSLGNFLANHVYWDNGDFLTWNRFEHTGCILLADLDQHGIHNVQQIPVYDNGQTIDIDTSRRGKRYINRANRLLERGVSPARYRRETFRARTLLPIKSQLRWGKLRRLQPRHFRKVLKLFFQGIKASP